ncbi:MAG: 23S rRNA (pseudouridine(1915)-N(3))-methyltransferase RlmH [Acidobacteria bacterium]|nr:23S rRNA (pseudouridine(1915)-N(3))-methyltransferase RlmH [Acidobacteriota bacterium]
MKLHLVWIGKTKERNCAALIADYQQRLARFTTIETSELKEPSPVRDEKRLVEREGERILAAVERDDFIVLLDERGRHFSSPALAEWIGARQQASVKRLAFIIGGFAGVSEAVKERAQLTWSLSQLTLPHELARVILAEQLYRAYTLLAGLPYHKS